MMDRTDEDFSAAAGTGAAFRPAGETGGRPAGGATGSGAPDTTEPLLAPDEAKRFQDRWERIQSTFVDEPSGRSRTPTSRSPS